MTVTLKFLKRFDWELLVSRNEALLLRSITHLGYLRSPSVTGLPWRPRAILNVGGGPYYYLASDLSKLQIMLAGKGLRFFSLYRSRLLRAMKNLETVARQVESTDCSALSHQSLRVLLQRYLEAAYTAHCFLTPLPIAGKVLEEEILALLPRAPAAQQQQWLFTLTFPEKENEHTQEERSFYRLAAAHRSKQFPALLQQHLKRFSWIGARWYWLDQGWTEQDIVKRLREFFRQRRRPRVELRKLDALRNKQRAERTALLQRLNISEKTRLRQYSKLGREFAFLRTLRTDIVYGSGFRARGLFFEIARRAGMKRIADVVYLSCREVLAMARTRRQQVTSAEVNRRKRFNALFTRGSSIIILSGPIWQKRLATIGPKPEIKQTVRGVSAFPGKAKGTVRIVIDIDDIAKVRRGNILVAVMTFPHFIPAMEKAAAFVTDEGGILCHTAIVAREMKKPCIIGTKIATQVLKDGDRVEVDATKGIVKKV